MHAVESMSGPLLCAEVYETIIFNFLHSLHLSKLLEQIFDCIFRCCQLKVSDVQNFHLKEDNEEIMSTCSLLMAKGRHIWRKYTYKIKNIKLHIVTDIKPSILLFVEGPQQQKDRNG